MIRTIFISLVLAVVGWFTIAPILVDWWWNSPLSIGPYAASDRAKALHQKLVIVDLHDDVLLWTRNILKRYTYGESDLPRLQEGNVAIQVFSTVTKTPKNLNFESNGSDTDNIKMLVMAQRWPKRTWDSLIERALYQSEKLHKAQENSEGVLRIIRTKEDLRAVLATKGTQTSAMGALLGTEGMHAIEGKLENIDRLYEAGFRIAGLTHFFDNEIGGSAHGLQKGGITPFGKLMIARLEEKSMLVDLAHASPKLIDDVIAVATKPIIVSHTGVKGTCNGPRNLSDEHIKGIAATGGVIGIGYFEDAVCEANAAGIVKAIKYTAKLAGIKHVALGSDFDGTAHNAFDATGLILITQGLIDVGFNDEEIADIMGGNVHRLLESSLPAAIDILPALSARIP